MLKKNDEKIDGFLSIIVLQFSTVLPGLLRLRGSFLRTALFQKTIKLA